MYKSFYYKGGGVGGRHSVLKMVGGGRGAMAPLSPPLPPGDARDGCTAFDTTVEMQKIHIVNFSSPKIDFSK